MKSRKGAMGALCLVGLLVAACGDDNKSSSSATNAGGTTAPAAGGTTAPAAGGSTAPAAGGDSLLNGTIKCEQQYAGKEVHISGVAPDTENDKAATRLQEG